MSKIINMWQNANGKIDDNNNQKCEQRSCLQNAEQTSQKWKWSQLYYTETSIAPELSPLNLIDWKEA